MSNGPWRKPAEESDDLYPGLNVYDNRVTGSITVGRSRLPIWAFIYEATVSGWDDAERNYGIEELGFTSEDLGLFLARLMQPRGELGRLLLMLANAERLQEDIYNNEPSPAAWWDVDAIVDPIVEQLRRCLAALDRRDGTPRNEGGA